VPAGFPCRTRTAAELSPDKRIAARFPGSREDERAGRRGACARGRARSRKTHSGGRRAGLASYRVGRVLSRHICHSLFELQLSGVVPGMGGIRFVFIAGRGAGYASAVFLVAEVNDASPSISPPTIDAQRPKKPQGRLQAVRGYRLPGRATRKSKGRFLTSARN
jgi:hypothetical protein